MKISITDTNFNSYRVARKIESWWRNLLGIPAVVVPLTHILEADEASGLVVSQVANVRGEPVYVNAAGDTVALTDAVKVLLLLPDIRAAFLQEFRPKVVQEYFDDLVITYQGAPSVAEAESRPVEGEVFMMKGGYDG